MASSENQSHHYDTILVASLLVYTLVGLMLLSSASEGNVFMLTKQIAHVILAVILATLINTLSGRQLQQLALYLYFFTIALLIFVLMFGHVGKGAQRWLDLKFIRFEPSEIMKIALPLMLASTIHNN